MKLNPKRTWTQFSTNDLIFIADNPNMCWGVGEEVEHLVLLSIIQVLGGL
jgi:hypothetical protein